MPLIVKAVVVDLDDTCVYFTDDLKGFYDLLNSYGIDQVVADKVVKSLFDQAQFTFSRMISLLARHYPAVNGPILLRKLNEWLHQNLQVYPDTVDHLLNWGKEVPIIILTAGDAKFQWTKISLFNLFYQETRFASPQRKKADHMLELIRRYGTPLVFVDDRMRNLDEIRTRGLSEKHVLTCQMERSNRPCQQRASFPHHRVKDFTEVDRLIRR